MLMIIAIIFTQNLETIAKQASELEHQNLSDTSTVQNDFKIILTKEGSGKDEAESSEKTEKIDKPKEIIRSDSIEIPKRNRSASIGCVEQNRTMVFILGRNDIRLISPDRKQVLLHKSFTDLVTIVQGVESSDHFGIICKETKENKTEFIGYVFKCQSGSIAHDIFTSVSKSLETLEQTRLKEEEKNHIAELMTCDHCPMVWYNRLCSTIEGLSDKKTHTTIIRAIEELSEEDQDIITTKFYGSDKVHDKDFSLEERNKFLIALIEAHCQMRQQRHVHDTIENRSEFLNQYLGGGTIFMKAKRSFIDHLLKRRGSQDVVDGNNNKAPTDHEEKRFKSRSMSLAANAPQTLTLKQREVEERQQVTTSKMDM
jgi:TBC1 domain family member 4